MQTVEATFKPAHPEDLLIVGWLQEALDYPQFHPRQVISANAFERIFGRRPRFVFLAPGVMGTPRSELFIQHLEQLTRRAAGSAIHPIDAYNEVTAPLSEDAGV